MKVSATLLLLLLVLPDTDPVPVSVPVDVARERLLQMTVGKSCWWDNVTRMDSSAATLACRLASLATLLLSI